MVNHEQDNDAYEQQHGAWQGEWQHRVPTEPPSPWWANAPNWGQFVIALLAAVVAAVAAIAAYVNHNEQRMVLVEERQAVNIRTIENTARAVSAIEARFDAINSQLNTIIVQLAKHEAREERK